MNTQENYDKVIEGLFKVESYKDGELVDTYEQKNKIMTTARTAMARNMTGKLNTTSPINRIVLGNMGYVDNILTPAEFSGGRTKLFSESHQTIKNITDYGFTFDGVDTITSSGNLSLVHNKTYIVTLIGGAKREFRKISTKDLTNAETYTIDTAATEPLKYPTVFCDTLIDMGLSFDGVSVLTNNSLEPITLSNDVVYLVKLTDGSVKQFQKTLTYDIPKEGGIYEIQTATAEPLEDQKFGKTFIVDFNSTDYSLMVNEDYHETIILASDGTDKSYQITGVQSYIGLPVAAVSSGININVITEGNKATYKFTIPQTQGNDEGGGVVAYTEAALYCDEKIFSMKTFPARTKDSSLEYVITWVITF